MKQKSNQPPPPPPPLGVKRSPPPPRSRSLFRESLRWKRVLSCAGPRSKIIRLGQQQKWTILYSLNAEASNIYSKNTVACSIYMYIVQEFFHSRCFVSLSPLWLRECRLLRHSSTPVPSHNYLRTRRTRTRSLWRNRKNQARSRSNSSYSRFLCYFAHHYCSMKS